MELEEFKIKVLPLRPKLLRHAGRLVYEPEDAVQEVLLKLWKYRDELDSCRSIEAFAMTMTRNVCIDMLRAQHDEQFHPGDCLVDAAATARTPEEVLEAQDEVQLVKHIIHSLPALQRSIMWMKDVEGYETEEIAAITGCNAEAIRSNLSRARKRVRDTYLQTIQRKRRNTEHGR